LTLVLGTPWRETGTGLEGKSCMRWNLSALFLICFVAAGAAFCSSVHDHSSSAGDEDALKDAGIAIDNKSLLEFFRRRTLTGKDQNKVALLIRQLGDDSFQHRATATSDLIGLGVIAIPYLRQALRSTDLEVVRRAEECLRMIEEKDVRVAVPVAALHLLARRKPADATEVLLAYIPYADHDVVIEEAKTTLAAVAVRDGKPDKTLLAAVTDALPERRAVAAEILCAAGVSDGRTDVKRLLQDPDLTVRLRAAVALTSARDRDAVPVLIDLLAKLPKHQAAQAEDQLLRLADEQAPPDGLGTDEAGHQKARNAWTAWWQEYGQTIDLAKFDDKPTLRGYTLVVLLEKGSVIELDTHNKPRLQIDGLRFPLDAQMLPGDRVLVAENKGDRVTERNRKGEIVWEKKVPSPLVAQRLRNGHTFIALQLNQQNLQGPQLLEVDRQGKELFSYTFPQGEMVMKAAKLPNGDIACVTNMRRFVRMDAWGKELKTFQVLVGTIGGRIDVLPDGHAIVPERDNNRVVEYDAAGNIAWQAGFSKPVAAVRLPNGNTLVTSFEPLPGKLSRAVELDRSGSEVWSYESDTRVTRAFRR
jgi:hypothetical protein